MAILNGTNQPVHIGAFTGFYKKYGELFKVYILTFFDLQNAGNSHVCSFGLKNDAIDHDIVRVMWFVWGTQRQFCFTNLFRSRFHVNS